jgi:hypothetical protein
MMAHLFWRRRHVCFACSAVAEQPCAGHEYGGTLRVWQLRPWARWVPFYLVRPPR